MRDSYPISLPYNTRVYSSFTPRRNHAAPSAATVMSWGVASESIPGAAAPSADPTSKGGIGIGGGGGGGDGGRCGGGEGGEGGVDGEGEGNKGGGLGGKMIDAVINEEQPLC